MKATEKAPAVSQTPKTEPAKPAAAAAPTKAAERVKEADPKPAEAPPAKVEDKTELSPAEPRSANEPAELDHDDIQTLLRDRKVLRDDPAESQKPEDNRPFALSEDKLMGDARPDGVLKDVASALAPEGGGSADAAEEPKPPTLGQTAQVIKDNLFLIDNADGKADIDGKIGRTDLEAAANDPNASQEVRDAAKAVLSNENYLNALDLGEGKGDADRNIDGGDLDAVLKEERENPQRLSIEQTAAVIRDNFELFDTAAGGGGKDNLIGQKDLTAIANNQSVSADVREAARALLDNDNYNHALDVAQGQGEVDGKIALTDVNSAADRGFIDDPGAAQDPAASMEAQNNVLTVAQNFDQLDVALKGGQPDGIIGEGDLRAALDNPSLAPELRDAVTSLLGNDAALNALDVGGGNGDVDGKFNRNDIVKFVSSGLERAAANAHDQDEIFSSFTAEYGQFIPPEELMASREAQKVQSAHAGHEALAENFTTLFKDPRFQQVFTELPEDQKVDLVQHVGDDLTGTIAGQEFIDTVVGDVAAIGRGEKTSSDNAFASFITDGRRVERSANQAYNNALNALLGTSVSQARTANDAVKLIDGFVGGSFAPEDAKKFRDALGPEFTNVANIVDSVGDHPTPAQVEQLNAARMQFAQKLEEANSRTDALGKGKPLGNALNVGAVVFDAYAISQHDWGEDLTKDTVLLASSARDVADVGKIAAVSLSRGAESLFGRAALSVTGSEAGTVAAGTRLAGGLSRVVPILGAAASFASAIASFHDDKVGFAADVLSGVGFTAIAAAPLAGPAAPLVATLGAVAVGVGGLVRLGEALYDLFTESDEEKAQQRYDDYSRQILGEAYGGDTGRVNDLVGLSDGAKMELSDIAMQMHVKPNELYEQMRQEWLSAGQPGSLSDFITA